MAKDKLTDYSSTAASNTDIGGISLAEGGMQVSDINNALREQMSHLKNFADGTHGIDVLNFQDDDASASIKLQAPSVLSSSTTFTLPSEDGTNGQFIKTDGAGALSFGSVAEFTLPSGLVFPYAGASAPTGYLFCFGQAISRTTYANLFTAISTTYGVGDNSTTFNLPDLRGRIIAGQDDMGGSSANRLTNQAGGLDGDTLGATGGSETHLNTSAQSGLVGHSHGVSASLQKTTGGGSAVDGIDFDDSANQGNNAGQNTSAISVSVSGVSSADASEAHNNVQPTIILNYIIKT
tara:strand:- start:1102 stop:1980 length:879 start_codon:yes stop_codon:yes gene_type:complete